MMDETVRKSWQLPPEHAKLTNPAWAGGMKKLTGIIADRLGYKGITLQCMLYKLLVYGEGGHFAKHQDTEKEGGMVATLVVQLPTLHEGGDLVVYRGNDVQHRHDFGKADGTAAFGSHYAVHYADAEHALEEVTSGYRLVLVYSLCLPPAMRHLMKRTEDTPLSEKLSEAMKHMDEDESFALLLSHEYTAKSVADLGSGALKGVDRARVLALEEANAIVPVDKKLHFYVAELKQEIDYYDTSGAWDTRSASWEENNRMEALVWYGMDGEKFGNAVSMQESAFGSRTWSFLKLNFLNPGKETLSELWKTHASSTYEGYLGNEGATKNTLYARYTVVAWPQAKAVDYAFEYAGVDAAAAALRSQNYVDAATLRQFMDTAEQVAKKWSARSYSFRSGFSVGFCRRICELLIEAKDVTLVDPFIKKFFDQLTNKSELVLSIIGLVRTFDWDDVGAALSNSFGQLATDAGLGLALQVVDGLEGGKGQTALLKAAVEKSTRLGAGVLASSSSIGLLWKWVVRCGDAAILDTIVNHFVHMDPSLLHPVIEGFSQSLDGSGNVRSSSKR